MAMRIEKNPQYLLVKPYSTPRSSFKQFKEYNVKFMVLFIEVT